MDSDKRTELAGRVARWVQEQVNRNNGGIQDASLIIALAAIATHARMTYPTGMSVEVSQKQFLDGLALAYPGVFAGISKAMQNG